MTILQVILVDDASDWEVPADFLAMEKVVGIKLKKREGLIRARTVRVATILASLFVICALGCCRMVAS